MDAQRWYVLAALSFALIGVIVYYWTLGKRLTRLKSILDKAPRDDSAVSLPVPRPESPVAAAAGAAPVGALFGESVAWVDESGIEGQRQATAGAPPKPVDSGATMLDRLGAMGAKAPAPAEGDLLKKLLSFENTGATAAPGEAPPAPAPSRPVDVGKPIDLFAPPTPKEAVPAPPEPQAASGMLGRLGAFSVGDVGAPESAKSKPAPEVKAPSFSLSGPLASRLERTEKPQPVAELAPAKPPAAERPKLFPDAPPAAPGALKALMGFGEESAPAPRPAVPPPAEGAKPASVLARLGAPEAVKTGGTSPMSALMSRLGGPAKAAEESPPAPPAAGGGSLSALLGKPAAPPLPPEPAPAKELLSRFGKPAEPAPAAPRADPFAALAKIGKKAPARSAGGPSPVSQLFKKVRKEAPEPKRDVAALEEAFLENQSNHGLKRELAEAYLDAGQIENAAEAFTELVESENGSESDIYNLGLALAKQGDVERATMCFTELTEQHRGSPWAQKAVGQLLKLKMSRGPAQGPKKLSFSTK